MLRGKSSERGSMVSESERQCAVRVMGELELLRLSVWVRVSKDALFWVRVW